jgi:DNA-binding ferritin-like protein
MNKFIDYINQGKSNNPVNEKVELPSDTGNVNMLLTETLYFANQIQLWHWLATSGQKHTALGDFYNSLRENIDSLAETLIAQAISLLTRGSKTLDVNYSDEVIKYQTKEYRQFITNIIDQLSTDKSDIANVRDMVVDIQECIDKFIYQFDLE